jgi:hypothetical protein
MKVKILVAVALFSAVSANAQWAFSCGATPGDISNNNPSGRVGIATCPGNSGFQIHDQVDIGGTGRLRFSGIGPGNTWHGFAGGVMGMETGGKLIIMGGTGGLGMTGDPGGANVNSLILTPAGNMGFGTLAPAEKLTVRGNIAPDLDNAYTCGTSALRWSDIWAVNGVIQTSDRRFKTNIKDLNYGLTAIMKLRPVTYNWISNDNGTRFGLIAQELKEVISEVVYTGSDKNQNLGVAYSELIPVLIKAIQEQQEQIANQNAEISALKGQMTLGVYDNSTSLLIDQNDPNPFTSETTIKYSLPASASSAAMIIYDLTGKQITKYPIESGSTSLTVTSEDLPAGIYIYSLYADGKALGSKRMVVSEK